MNLLKMKKKIILIASIGIFYLIILKLLLIFEQKSSDSNINSIFDAFWYSLITLSTVGYGDFYPTTVIGKIIGLLFVFGSLGLIGYLIGLLTQKVQKYMEDKKFGLLGTKMENHIIIIGYDKFSVMVIKQIVASGKEVAVITNNKDDIDHIKSTFNKNIYSLFTDYENFESLEKANITKSSKVFINFNDDTEMLVYIINLKTYFPNIEIVVSLNNSKLKSTFQSAGVLFAISREEIVSKLVASYIFEPDVAILTEDLISSAEEVDDYDIMEFHVNDKNLYLQKGYDYVFNDSRKRFGAVLLGVSKSGTLYKNPVENIEINENDYLIFMGNSKSKNKITQTFMTEQGRLN